jgi:asparagine synthase (glutamine-hydrolysing)
MSGMCGIFCRDGEAVTGTWLESMLGKLHHRGPDRQSTWARGAVGLGHAMLCTTPESLEEMLPQSTEGDRYAITADARIDNRAELLAALKPDVHPDSSDSALILAAYRKWGDTCPERLQGDFAFAVWDAARRQVFCACDPMGVKSLYYHLAPASFQFASEIKALLVVPGVPCRLNELRVAEYLVTLLEDRAGTFYRDILRLPGAHCLTVNPERARVWRYWELDARRELRLGSDAEYVEAFREIFTEAVRCRTRSAFPVGSSLSGGLDSSSVACVARAVKAAGRGPLHTFSLIFPSLPVEDRRLIDERPHMEAVLATGGFEPHFIQADLLSPMGQVDRMHYHLDHANCAPNLYLHWAMYDCARQNGVRVFLDGFDGDSAVSHGFERLTELAQNLHWPTLWRELTLLSRNQLAGIRPARIAREYCLKPLTPRWAFLIWHWLRGRRREALSENLLIGPELKQQTGIEQRARAMLKPQYRWSLRRSARESHKGSISQALYSFTLEIADKASAAFGMEARYPFFDRRVLEFCLALPAEQKLGQGWNRWILRRAMAGILPEAVQWRPKKGNLSPNFHRRLLDFERATLEQVVHGDSPELARYLDAAAMRAVYREYQKHHARSRGESIQLFAAVNLALWLRSRGFAS